MNVRRVQSSIIYFLHSTVYAIQTPTVMDCHVHVQRLTVMVASEVIRDVPEHRTTRVGREERAPGYTYERSAGIGSVEGTVNDDGRDCGHAVRMEHVSALRPR